MCIHLKTDNLANIEMFGFFKQLCNNYKTKIILLFWTHIRVKWWIDILNSKVYKQPSCLYFLLYVTTCLMMLEFENLIDSQMFV
jgi:hypothetical protein